MDVPKLQDAHSAGSSKSTDCTLVLTEGDSAMALAVAGLEVVGRQVLEYGSAFTDVKALILLQIRFHSLIFT